MSCLVWNCRGLGTPRKVPILKKEILSKAPTFVFLCETKLLTNELRRVAGRLGFSCCLGVDCELSGGGRGGGLGLMWNVDCVVQLKSFSSNHIDIHVGGVDVWRFTGIYGHPEDDQKWRTWGLLRQLAQNCDIPWLCVGDFNEILFDHEKVGGSWRRYDRMGDFCHCLEDCGLSDLGFMGHQFTWSNNRAGGNNIHERLDRGVANDRWLTRFPSTGVSHLTRLMSDHCPLLVNWATRRQNTGNINRKKIYRFEAMWLQEDGLRDIIDGAWRAGKNATIFGFSQSVGSCSKALTTWGNNLFGSLPKEIANCKKELDDLHTQQQTLEIVQEARALENRLAALIRREEIFWYQRSRVNWMREGDRNTKFFHRIASGRKKRNQITAISDEFGVLYEEEQDIQRVFVNYFTKLFSAKESLDMDDALGAVEHRVSGDMLTMLSQPFTEEEVTKALFQMHPCKAPGPDEALSALIRKNVESGALHGLRICRGAPMVSNLFFADDTLIFGRAMEPELLKIKEILGSYESASGQFINLQKSDILFSGGIVEERGDFLASVLGVRRVQAHSKYLGLPTNVEGSRMATFRVLAEGVEKKLKDWKCRTMSQAGKLTLIKSVAQAIPSYLMSCFIIPQGIIDRIRSAIVRFWWGQVGEEKRTHWLRWEELCKPKWEGGLGLRDLAIFNRSLLAKQGWRLIHNANSLLARNLRARYFPNDDFLTSGVGFNPSAIWKGMLAGRQVLQFVQINWNIYIYAILRTDQFRMK